MSSLKVVLAQIDPLVGDIPGNANKIINVVSCIESQTQADIIVFPELTIMGYPPEDLLLRPSVSIRIERALQRLLQVKTSAVLVVGYPRIQENRILNMAGVIQNGRLQAEYAKQCLPNYRVFDDKRYFTAGENSCVLELNGIKTAILICEDIWEEEPLQKAVDDGAKAVFVLNASPFHLEKHSLRCQVLAGRAEEGKAPIVYVNQVGGQDELVFDGGSMVVNRQGDVQCLAPFFKESLLSVCLKKGESGDVDIEQQQLELIDFKEGGASLIQLESFGDGRAPSELSLIYQALVLGVRDYVNKNGFSGVVLGLSGGIDSALTLAIAVDALGNDKVEAVMMPFHYTSQMSQDDAEEEAKLLSVRYQSISIAPMYEAFMAALKGEFAGLPADQTEENIQARCRGVLLMSISNKKGYLVLTTGNKSELAVGYATLYGDMAGGFDVLKDVPKTVVFELASYRNSLSKVIPQSVIDRPPSAELAPDQKDEDSLPPYSVLDAILEAYIEQDHSADYIIQQGFDAETVRRVIRLVDINEYKRRQAPIGPRITERGFGRDRRYPVTSGWKMGE